MPASLGALLPCPQHSISTGLLSRMQFVRSACHVRPQPVAVVRNTVLQVFPTGKYGFQQAVETVGRDLRLKFPAMTDSSAACGTDDAL